MALVGAEMDVNQRTAKMPFWVLYVLAAAITVFDLVFTYSFLGSNREAYEANPVHECFAGVFGLEYFLFLVPVSLVAIYGIAKVGGWAIRHVDKDSEINGENYMAVVVILLTFPNVLLNEVFLVLFGTQLRVSRFDLALILAIALTLGYIVLAEIADRKAKKRRETKA
jgi:hypothetical protein